MSNDLVVSWTIPAAGDTNNKLLRRNLDLIVSSINTGFAFTPAHSTDANADNDTIYYSTTASKLVYKDTGGSVHALY